jgi:phospholipid/cholesterol/gamma-HCH transport system substrate-binding protein
VRYRVPIGSVASIKMDYMTLDRVLLDIDPTLPSRTVATLGLEGITGVAYVNLTGGAGEHTQAQRGEDYPEPIEGLSLDKVLEDLPKLRAGDGDFRAASRCWRENKNPLPRPR